MFPEKFLRFKSMKDRITRDIKNFFEQQKNDNYKPISVRNFGEIIILDMKAMKIKIEIRIMINDNADDFTFDCAYLLCYEYHEINLDLGGSHINFPD